MNALTISIWNRKNSHLTVVTLILTATLWSCGHEAFGNAHLPVCECPADEFELSNVVVKRVEDVKKWPADVYVIKYVGRDGDIVTFYVYYKGDDEVLIPGGGQSFYVIVDAKRKVALKELYAQ